MQKIINVLSIASFVISASIAGAGIYVYANKDALIEGAKEKIIKQELLMVCLKLNQNLLCLDI